MSKKATSKLKESILLRLDADLLHIYKKMALEMSTPENRVTTQEAMRQKLADFPKNTQDLTSHYNSAV
jgi:hypothetical protein